MTSDHVCSCALYPGITPRRPWFSASSRLLLTVQWQKQETQAAKLNATISVRLAHLEYKERTEKSDEFGQLM